MSNNMTNDTIILPHSKINILYEIVNGEFHVYNEKEEFYIKVSYTRDNVNRLIISLDETLRLIKWADKLCTRGDPEIDVRFCYCGDNHPHERAELFDLQRINKMFNLYFPALVMCQVKNIKETKKNASKLLKFWTF